MRAIAAGERDAPKLAKLRHAGIHASEGEIVKSLQGNRREEHLFALKQALNPYDSYQSSIGECDEQLARVLGKWLLTMSHRPIRPTAGGADP